MYNTENLITQEDKNKLIGIDDLKSQTEPTNWKKCMYCEKFHHLDFFPKDVEYCVHCWAWLNSHEYNIQEGVYMGIHKLEEIQKTLKRAYPIHLEIKCVNHDCLFDKIKKYNEIKILHPSLSELLELNKKPKQIAISFNNKNKALNVDYEKSFIVM